MDMGYRTFFRIFSSLTCDILWFFRGLAKLWWHNDDFYPTAPQARQASFHPPLQSCGGCGPSPSAETKEDRGRSRYYYSWLVVLTILKNISQWEGWHPIYDGIRWKIKHVPNHQPDRVIFIGFNTIYHMIQSIQSGMNHLIQFNP